VLFSGPLSALPEMLSLEDSRFRTSARDHKIILDPRLSYSVILKPAVRYLGGPVRRPETEARVQGSSPCTLLCVRC
jgi:hypothetical protein